MPQAGIDPLVASGNYVWTLSSLYAPSHHGWIDNWQFKKKFLIWVEQSKGLKWTIISTPISRFPGQAIKLFSWSSLLQKLNEKRQKKKKKKKEKTKKKDGQKEIQLRQ